MWTEWLTTAAILVGVFFMFVSSVGVLRMPDFYLRLHAPTKAATLGLICLLVAVTAHVRERTVATKAVLVVLFIGTTAPVGGHLLARAAYRTGVSSSGEPVLDEYAPVVRRGSAPGGGVPARAHDPDRD